MHASSPTVARRAGAQRVEVVVCAACTGDGWADPFDVFDGSPPLTWCHDCLGAAVDDCRACGGDGWVTAWTACPACGEELFLGA